MEAEKMDDLQLDAISKNICMDSKKRMRVIAVVQDAEMLHVIAYNYNWDDGFEIPKRILNNKIGISYYEEILMARWKRCTF